MHDIVEYYARRAPEYERIYDIRAKQSDLGRLRRMIQDSLSGRDILEVACGTGYWTELIARAACSITAVDINQRVINLASAKSYPKRNATFALADAYRLERVSGMFSAGFAGFWWSHVSRSRIREFLTNLHRRLEPGALAVFVDDSFVDGVSRPMSDRVDVQGNTYSPRILDDGSEWEILKNFPTESDVRDTLAGIAADIRFTRLRFYWLLSYRVEALGVSL